MRMSIDGVVGEISSMPGCSQIAISHSVFLPESERGKGKGVAANRKRQELVFGELSYDLMLCTVQTGNYAQLEVMRKNGWYRLDCFKSRKTGHDVELWACRAGQ